MYNISYHFAIDLKIRKTSLSKSGISLSAKAHVDFPYLKCGK